MLEVRGISAAYGTVPVLRELSFEARAGEILCLLGRNGAGKTTTCKAVMGLLRLTGGAISWNGMRLDTLPAHDVPRRGIGYIPQGRRLFGEMSVAENLAVGMQTRASPRATLDAALDLFPALRTRLKQRAETLSGGEQTMLTVARALCVAPDLLILDEPTEGLQPSMVKAIQDVVLRLRDQGRAIVLVEQKIEAVMATADRVVFVEGGTVVDTADAATLRAAPGLLRARLGV